MEYETGDTCPECGKGRIPLLSCFIDRADKDSEPYKGGIEEGNEEEVRLNDNISVCIHACDECGHIVRRWFSDFYPDD